MDPRVLVLAGTFLPLIGAALTVVAAAFVPRRARGPVLVLVPAAVAVACWFATPFVWRDGNLLAAALYLAYWGGLVLVYYPLLLVRRLTAGRRRPPPSAPTPSPDAPRAAGSSAP